MMIYLFLFNITSVAAASAASVSAAFRPTGFIIKGLCVFFTLNVHGELLCLCGITTWLVGYESYESYEKKIKSEKYMGLSKSIFLYFFKDAEQKTSDKNKKCHNILIILLITEPPSVDLTVSVFASRVS